MAGLYFEQFSVGQVFDHEIRRRVSEMEAARAGRRTRRDGFTAPIAIRPNQVAITTRCLRPPEEEIAEARKIADAVAASPDVGTLGIDGKVVDIARLKAARRTLASA